MDKVTQKAIEKILKSRGYSKRDLPRSGSLAPITEHYYDDMEIRQAHNGQESFAVYFHGDMVGRIPRKDFYDTMEERTQKQTKSFLDS